MMARLVALISSIRPTVRRVTSTAARPASTTSSTATAIIASSSIAMKPLWSPTSPTRLRT